jgi:hypothetical protein
MWRVSTGLDVSGNVHQRESSAVSRTIVALYGMSELVFYI